MPVPVMVVEQGRKIAACEQPWLTMVNMVSCPVLFGNPVMRSMVMWENGLALMADGIRNIGVLMWCVRFLFCWQVVQPLMYSVIQVLVPGQKYSLLMCLIILSCPGWPLIEPSCHMFISSRFNL